MVGVIQTLSKEILAPAVIIPLNRSGLWHVMAFRIAREMLARQAFVAPTKTSHTSRYETEM